MEPDVRPEIPVSPDIVAAFKGAQLALAGDSNNGEHDALLALVEALESCNLAQLRPSGPAWEPERLNEIPCEGVKMKIPTYNGKWLEVPHLKVADYGEPEVPVLVCPADGVRIVLGTHDYHDLSRADIQVERRHNGWMIFLRPLGGSDVSGFVVFLDDGRSYACKEEAGGPTVPIAMVDHDEAVAELDDIKDRSIFCSQPVIIRWRSGVSH